MMTCPRDRTRRPGGRAAAKAKATARGVYPVEAAGNENCCERELRITQMVMRGP